MSGVSMHNAHRRRPPRSAGFVVFAAFASLALTVLVITAPAATAGPGPIANPSLEVDANADGVPDCFTTGGFGNNTATFTRVADAHAGTWGERLAITAYTDGDRKLVPSMVPGCAPTAVPGERYTISAWYHSNVSVEVVVYVLRSGVWEYWLSGAAQPASGTYRRAMIELPGIPGDVTAVSFGLAIGAVGEVVTDDYTIATTGATPPCAAGYVALTYDDGPGDHTATLLDSLTAKGARATFFLTGDQISPAREPLVRRQVAEHHIVANHTWTHPRLTALTTSQVRAEFTQLNNKVVSLGAPKPNLWRPPYSDTNTRVDNVATGLGMTKTFFAVDTGDADVPGISVEETRLRAVEGAQAGAIIIMHDIIANSVTATPMIIDDLRGRGFCFGIVRPSATYNPLNRSNVEVVP
jgi:peptidoglycan/xylan/chitin deacetylase (PgdA/CDA1 family)